MAIPGSDRPMPSDGHKQTAASRLRFDLSATGHLAVVAREGHTDLSLSHIVVAVPHPTQIPILAGPGRESADCQR